MRSRRALSTDGGLDAGSASISTNGVDAALAAGTRELVIDLRDVAFVDVDGLLALAAARSRAAVLRGYLRLRPPSKRSMDLLLMAELDHTL